MEYRLKLEIDSIILEFFKKNIMEKIRKFLCRKCRNLAIYVGSA